MCHLKKCDRHVTVFALSKHGQQLHEHQCLTAWLFNGVGRTEKSLGRREATGRDRPHTGLGEHTQGTSHCLHPTGFSGILQCMRSYRVSARGQSCSKVCDSCCPCRRQSPSQEEMETERSGTSIFQGKHGLL